MSWRSSCATTVAIACTLCAPALGSPRSDPTVARAVFTGAATANATSIDVNPAAIGLGVRSELYFAAIAVLDRYSIDLRALDVNTGALTEGPPGTTDFTTSPGGALGGIFHTGSDSRITLGGMLRTSPGERFLEEDAFRFHTSGGYHRTVSLAAAASLRVTNRFFVGVSVALQSNYLKLRYSRDTALEAGRDPDRGITSDCDGAPCGFGNPVAEERYEVEASSDLVSASNVVATLGIVVRLAKETWIGIGYHAPPGLAIQNELSGTLTATRAPRDGREIINGVGTVYISQPASLDIELRSRLPRLLDLHVGGRWEDLARFQSYDVRGYGSTLPENGIPEWQPRPRGFHNSLPPLRGVFALWAGVEQVERESPLVLGARLGLETSAVDDNKTSPLTIAPTSATLDVGLQYRLSTSLVLQLTYGLQYFPTVDVTESRFDPRARIACFDSGFDYTTPGCTSVRHGYAIATAAGEYQRIEQAMRLAVRVELQ